MVLKRALISALVIVGVVAIGLLDAPRRPARSGSADAVETDGTASTSTGEIGAYARAHRVTLEEALQRSKLQERAGELDADLSAPADPGYAGLWIEHEPRFRVVVAATGDAVSRVQAEVVAATKGTDLEPIVEVESVRYSLARLEADQLSLVTVAQELKLNTSIEVMRNRVVVTPTDEAGLAALETAELPATVNADLTIHVARPAADAYAGGSLSNGCTSGFTLVYTTTSPDTYFTSTAGHCSSPATLNGVSITYSSSTYEGNYDLKFGNVKTLTPRNWMRVSSSVLRSVTSRTTKSGQAINTYICKYGRSTGQTCGYLVSKAFTPSYVPNASNGFHQVAPQGGPDMVNGGDSGGPVYRNYSAWGIVSGEYGLPWCVCDLIYSPIPYAEGNGLEQMQPRHVYYVP